MLGLNSVVFALGLLETLLERMGSAIMLKVAIGLLWPNLLSMDQGKYEQILSECKIERLGFHTPCNNSEIYIYMARHLYAIKSSKPVKSHIHIFI